MTRPTPRAAGSPRWHWLGDASVATHNGCALVEHHRYSATHGHTYAVVIVRGRGRFEVTAPTSKQARARAIEVADALRPPRPPAAGALAAPAGCAS